MELELISENKSIRVQYDRTHGVLWAEHQGLVSIDLAKESFKDVLDVLPQYPLRAAIFDCMKMRGTFTKLNPWLNEVWYPALIPQGYCCWSMATADVFSRFAGNMLINQLTPKEIKASIFNSLEKAQVWTYDYLQKTNAANIR